MTQQTDPVPDLVVPHLRQAFVDAPEGELFHVYAALDQRLRYTDFVGQVESLGRGVRQQYVEDRLRAFADARQGGILALLGELEAAGAVRDVRQLWITNTVIFEGTQPAIERVAALPEVGYIGWDPKRDPSEVQDVLPAPAAGPAPAGGGAPSPEINLVKLQAPALWAMGYDGTDTVLMNIDSGTDLFHPDLKNRIWINPLDPLDDIDNDGNGYIDDINGWDFQSNDNNPGGGSHGTSTAGIMVGDGSAGIKLTGMAPGAQLVIGKIGGEADHWEAQQYGISVSIDCSSSSFSFKWPNNPDYHMHRSVSEMVLAAGIIHANSIGNQGGSPTYPVPFNISAPGICPSPWKHTTQTQFGGGVAGTMACGGIELNDTAWEDIKIYKASYPHAQDPTKWDYPYGGFGGGMQGLIKPDVVTYTNVQSTAIGGGYTSFGGTSAATPHLGGAFALVIDAQPLAQPRHLSQALQRSAQDLGHPGKDIQFGAGKVQVLDAAKRLFHLVTADTLSPSIGSSMTIAIDGFASDFYAALWSTGLGSALTPVGTLDLGTPFYVLRVAPLDGAGHDAIPVVIPNDPGLVGVDIHVQSIEDNNAGAIGQYLFSVVETFRIAP